jgi:hypothetical protein
MDQKFMALQKLYEKRTTLDKQIIEAEKKLVAETKVLPKAESKVKKPTAKKPATKKSATKATTKKK